MLSAESRTCAAKNSALICQNTQIVFLSRLKTQNGCTTFRIDHIDAIVASIDAVVHIDLFRAIDDMCETAHDDRNIGVAITGIDLHGLEGKAVFEPIIIDTVVQRFKYAKPCGPTIVLLAE